MIHLRLLTLLWFTALLAGCATVSAPKTERAGNGPGRRPPSKDAHVSVVAMKNDGIDDLNFSFWKRVVPVACQTLQSAPRASEQRPPHSGQFEHEFGSLRQALAPFFETAGEAAGQPTLPPGASWEEFYTGLNLLASRLEGAPRQWQSLVGLLGGSLGPLPRWQLWYAERLSRGLTLEELVRSGKASRELFLEHWSEADSGNYMKGATKAVFGKAWQPKEEQSIDPRKVAVLRELLIDLADGSIPPEERVSRCWKVLDNYRGDTTRFAGQDGPQICASQALKGLEEIETPEDFRNNEKETASAPHAGRQGRRQGGRSLGSP